jgi:hypothetical protein
MDNAGGCQAGFTLAAQWQESSKRPIVSITGILLYINALFDNNSKSLVEKQRSRGPMVCSEG